MKINSQNARKARLCVAKPRPELLVLFGVQKPITLVHAFRLAEALNAPLILGATPLVVGSTLRNDAVSILDEFFSRWHTVSFRVCLDANELKRILCTDGYRPVAIEITDQALPYPEFHPHPREKLALIVGSENDGIDVNLLNRIADHVFIPMAGTSTCFAAGMALAIVAAHFAFVDAGRLRAASSVEESN